MLQAVQQFCPAFKHARSPALAHGLGRHSESIFLTLRRELQRGTYDPGQKLPTEQSLCTRFEVSRATVRRAVARLVDEGFVRVRRGAGMYVCGDAGRAAGVRTLSFMYPFTESEHLEAAQDVALQKGFLCNLFSQQTDHWDSQRERAFLQLVLEHQQHALLACCSPKKPRNEDLLAALVRSGVRVIHVEHFRERLPDESYILPNYERAGHMAAIALMLSGAKDIRVVSGNPTAPPGILLEQGVATAHEDHRGPDRHDERYLRIPPEGNAAYEKTLQDLMQSLGQRAGLVCSSAHLASKLVQRLRATGYRVPEDVSVVGVEVIGDRMGGDPVDVVRFDRSAILDRAVTLATARTARPVHELVAPQLERHGTTRSPETDS